MAEAAAGIRQQGIDLTTLRRRIELVHAFDCRKIGLNSLDFRAIAHGAKPPPCSISGSSAAIRRS